MGTKENFWKNEVETLVNDINTVEAMSEAEMREFYNTDDSKEDFLEFLRDELEVAQKHIGNDDACDCGIDEGFANEADYLRYKYA